MTVEPAEAVEPLSPAPSGPYKFLDHFGDNDRDRRSFAGRDLEIRELVALITNGAVLVLYGRSGIGKTSLILAGLFPELRARGYKPVYARTLVDPIGDLREAIASQCGLESAAGSLREVAERAAETGSIAVVIDQFEEFFIRFREQPDLRAELTAAAADIVNDQDLDVTLVFSLREEYLAALDELAEKVPNLFSSRYRLRPLTAFGVRQAISRPLIESGIPYEEVVVSKLVDQLEEFGFDPAVVQIICSELYKEAASRARAEGKTPRITAEDLNRVGGLDGIFKRYLDGAATGIPERLQLLARIVLDSMITRESTKRAATLEDLLSSRFSAPREDVAKVLDLLTERGLLRCQVRDGVRWYELMHERLIEHIEDWLNLDPAFLTFRQARIFVRNNWIGDLWREKPETLLNAEVLAALLDPHKELFRFEDQELEFVLRSVVYRCSDAVKFWAEQHGQEKTLRLLVELSASERPLERVGAATAAGRLEDPDGRLASLCLRLVLEDSEPQVRRAAGLSLARRARPEEIDALVHALKQRPTRARAREALTYLREGGHSLAEFSRLRRWSASRGAERRVFREKHNSIQDRSKAGAREGALGGLAAGALVGAMFIGTNVGDTPVDTSEWILGFAAGTVVFAAGGALLGSLLGWLAASAAAKEALMRGEGRWFHAMLRIRLFLWCGLVLGAGCYAIGRNAETLTYLAIFLGAGLLVPVLLGAVARLNRSAVWPGVPPRSIWLWSLLSSLGLPFLLLWVLSTVLSGSATFGEFSDELSGLAFILALVVSFTTLVLSLALARSSPDSDVLKSPKARPWARGIAASAALLLPVWFVISHGLGTVPLLARDVRLDRPIDWKPGLAFPAAGYVRLRNGKEELQALTVESLQGPATFELVGVPLYLREAHEGYVIALPPGEHLARFHQRFYQKDAPRKTTEVRLQPVAVHSPLPDPVRLSWADRKKFLLPLAPVPGRPGSWQATLRGVVIGGPDDTDRTLTVKIWAKDRLDVSMGEAPLQIKPAWGSLRFLAIATVAVQKDGTWKCDLVVTRPPEEPPILKAPLVQVLLVADYSFNDPIEYP